jgi:flagellar M-ring protein FliF
MKGAMRGLSSPSAVVMVAALASVMCLQAQPAYAAMPMVPHRLGAVDSGPVSRAGAVGLTVRRNDAATAAYQERLNSALQTMLDAVVGPGRAVVTTTAELNFDQVETVTTTYARDPAAGALSERISSRAYTDDTGGTRYESTSTARANALNSLRETRRTAPGRVEKLNIAVLVDATAGRNIDLAQLTELVSVAAGVDAGRGDTVAVAAMPMRPGLADTAANTLAEPGTAATADRQWMPAAAAVALLFLIGVVARRRYRRAAAQRDDMQRMRAAVEGRRPIVATADLAAPAPGDPRHDGIERQRQIGRLAGDDPGQAAAVLRGWTGSDR